VLEIDLRISNEFGYAKSVYLSGVSLHRHRFFIGRRAPLLAHRTLKHAYWTDNQVSFAHEELTLQPSGFTRIRVFADLAPPMHRAAGDAPFTQWRFARVEFVTSPNHRAVWWHRFPKDELPVAQ
jgi:hypothetical protein